MTRRARRAQPAPSDPAAVERRARAADRRDDARRRKVELLLDRFFRPHNWAVRIAYALRLQGGPPSEVDRQALAVPRENDAPPLTIAFASDFRAGATTDARVIAEACDALDSLRPDVLLLGGDFVSVRASDIHALAAMLARIRAPLGKFAVLGNHDLRSDSSTVSKALEAAGVRVLENEVIRLAAPHHDVAIIGLDDPIRGKPDGEILDDVAGVRIVLMHAPDGLLAIGDRDFDLALCGHTHGGQIALPGGTMPYLPSGKLSRVYAKGLYRLGTDEDETLIVSRGVGCSTLPFRVWCRSQVHVITL